MKILVKEKLSEHKSKTPEGYLICQDAILARTGDQGYLKSELYEDFDGEDSMIQVQRKPEQVFAAEALSSFEDKPITIEHPDENVGPDNYSDLAVGHTRNVRKGKFNGQDVMIADLVITDSQAIEEIENGVRTELSCGYDCDITEGDHPEQINIRGNHIALCKEGRAGIAKIIDSKPEEIKDAVVNRFSGDDCPYIQVLSKKIYYDAFGVWPRNIEFVYGPASIETEKAWYVYLHPQSEFKHTGFGWTRLYDQMVWVPKSVAKKLTIDEFHELYQKETNSLAGKKEIEEKPEVVEDSVNSLPSDKRKELSKYFSSISKFTGKDIDISDIIEPIKAMGHNVVREKINGWNKMNDGMFRKDYLFSIDDFDDVFMVSLYANPDTFEVTEVNAYFVGKKKDIADIKIEDVSKGPWTVMYAWADEDGDPYTGTAVAFAETEDGAKEIITSYYPKASILRVVKGAIVNSFDYPYYYRKKNPEEDADFEDVKIEDKVFSIEFNNGGGRVREDYPTIEEANKRFDQLMELQKKPSMKGIDPKKLYSDNNEEVDEEETARCAWCDEEYPVEEMKKEQKIGYLCPYCIQAIRSRGEKLVIEDTEDKEINLKEFISSELSPEYTEESGGTIIARFTAEADAERAIENSSIKDIPYNIIDDESAYYVMYMKEDIKDFINENKLLCDSSDGKHVLYMNDGIIYITSFENYNAKHRDMQAIHPIFWTKSFEKAIEYLMEFGHIDREDIITIGDPDAKSEVKDAAYRPAFYKAGIKEFEKKLKKLSKSDDNVRDENELEYAHQKRRIYEVIKEQIAKYKESLEESETMITDSDDTLDTFVKRWYCKTFPSDEVGETLNENTTFGDVFDCLDAHNDIYDILGGDADSVVRERVFNKLAELIGTDYEYVYNQWLKSNG